MGQGGSEMNRTPLCSQKLERGEENPSLGACTADKPGFRAQRRKTIQLGRVLRSVATTFFTFQQQLRISDPLPFLTLALRFVSYLSSLLSISVCHLQSSPLLLFCSPPSPALQPTWTSFLPSLLVPCRSVFLLTPHSPCLWVSYTNLNKHRQYYSLTIVYFPSTLPQRPIDFPSPAHLRLRISTVYQQHKQLQPCPTTLSAPRTAGVAARFRSHSRNSTLSNDFEVVIH